MRQLHVEHRGLDLVEPEIAADELVVVLRLHAVHAQLHELRGQRFVVGDAGAGITEGAEVLGGEERQAADVADGAGAPALRVFGADGLRGIFDDAQAVTARDLHDARHVGHLAVQVHGHDGAHASAVARLMSTPSRARSVAMNCSMAAARC